MDITLERILSLIPKKADGKYVHGAKKEFADSLGLSHNLISMWISGQSVSYRSKLYEIADKYNVSVAWLKGETDEKNPSVNNDEDEGVDVLLERLRDRPECRMLFKLADDATVEDIKAAAAVIEALRKARE